jgi:hypothetical protein
MGGSSDAPKYVYGVVRASPKGRLKSKGINGKPIRIISTQGLGALTSDVSEEPVEAGRDELLTHSRVLESALERGTVLPMRFGVVMPDEGAVRSELLDAHRDELEAQLTEMAGKSEMNVKAIYDEGAVLSEVLAENPDIARVRESLQGQSEDGTYYQRIELGERIVGALEEKRAGDEHLIVERLAGHALALEVAPPMHERMAVNASFLVASEAMAAFDTALDEIAAENAERLRFKATGPLPPHSFVELDLGA